MGSDDVGEQAEEWLSGSGARARFGVSWPALTEWAKKGRVRRVGKPGSFRYSAADLATVTAPEERVCGYSRCGSTFVAASLTHRFCSRLCLDRERMATMPLEKRRARARATRARHKERIDARVRAWKATNPERTRELYRRSALNRRFGISLEAYWALDAANDGRCWLCDRPKREKTPAGRQRGLCVDHDHSHDKGDPTSVRGLLCTGCNVGLKAFEDEPWHSAAAAYLASSTTLVLPDPQPGERSEGRLAQYGMTPSQLEWLHARQDGRCATCSTELALDRRANVDHDHAKRRGEAGYVRGLLCSHCNTKVGRLENTAFASAARRYLAAAQPRAQRIIAEAHATHPPGAHRQTRTGS